MLNLSLSLSLSLSQVINDEIEQIKQELKFHFMNPFEKWKYPSRRRFPWKLIVQLLLILLVTTQVRQLDSLIHTTRSCILYVTTLTVTAVMIS